VLQAITREFEGSSSSVDQSEIPPIESDQSEITKMGTTMSGICSDFAQRASLLESTDLISFAKYGGPQILTNAIKGQTGLIVDNAVCALEHTTSYEGNDIICRELEENPSSVLALVKLCHKQNADKFDVDVLIGAVEVLAKVCSCVDQDTAFEVGESMLSVAIVTTNLSHFIQLIDVTEFTHNGPLFGPVLHLLAAVSAFDSAAGTMFHEGVFELTCKLSHSSVVDEVLLEYCAIILGNLLCARSQLHRTIVNEEANLDLVTDSAMAHERLNQILGEDNPTLVKLNETYNSLIRETDNMREIANKTGHSFSQNRVLVLHSVLDSSDNVLMKDSSNAGTAGASSASKSSNLGKDMVDAMASALMWTKADGFIRHTISVVDKLSTFDRGLHAHDVTYKLQKFFAYEHESLLVLQCSFPSQTGTGDWMLMHGTVVTFVDLMQFWINSPAKRSGTTLLILSEGDHSGVWVTKAKHAQVSQLVIHSSCTADETSTPGIFFGCFKRLQSSSGKSMEIELRTLAAENMHPQLYAAPELLIDNRAHDPRRKMSAIQKIQVVTDDKGHEVLLINMMRGVMIRFCVKEQAARNKKLRAYSVFQKPDEAEGSTSTGH